MNYKFLLLILFLCSCASNNINRTVDTSDNINRTVDTSDNINKDNDVILKYSFSNFSNKGFTLIYDDSLKKKNY